MRLWRKTRPKLIVQKVAVNALLPTYGTSGAGCFDLAIINDVRLSAGSIIRLDTGLKVIVPDGYVLEIISRSGWASNGLTVANSPGIVDSDYRGPLMVLLHTKYTAELEAGERVAQARLVRVEQVDIKQGLVPVDTERGEQGFGSTGQ